MGTGNSKASIAIQVNSLVLIPGNMVHGKIYLHVNADKVDGEQLVVRLTGCEFAQVRWTTTSKDSDGNSHTHHHSHHTTSTFLDMPYVLSTIPNGCFLKGQYEFPFQFMVPPGVIPSMQASVGGDHGGDCCVYYKLEARLHRKGWLKWDVKNHIHLQVLATPLPFTSFPAYIPPQEKDIHLCCCYKRGTATVGMHTPSALMAPGENFSLSYVLQNNSHTRVKAIEITLVETVSWHSGGHRRQSCVNLFHQRLEGKTLPEQLVNTINQRKAATAGGSYDAGMVRSMAALKELLDANQYECQGHIAETARFTMAGRLITVTHTLMMKICTPFGNSNPSITYPMTLYSAPNLSVAVKIISPSNENGTEKNGDAMSNTISNPMGSDGSTIAAADWRPSVIATEVVFPTAVYMNPVEGDPDSINTDLLAPSAPPMSTATSSSSIDQLYYALQHTYSPATEVKNWIAANGSVVNTLTAEQYGKIYSLLSGILDQLQATDMLVNACISVTCDQIVAIAQYASPLIKTQIISKFAAKCSDKENRAKIEAVISPFDYLCVARDFA